MLLIAVLSLYILAFAYCQQVTWNSLVSGIWSSDDNWDPSSPTSTSDVTISPSSSDIVVSIDEDSFASSIYLSNLPTISLSSGITLTVTNTLSWVNGFIQGKLPSTIRVPNLQLLLSEPSTLSNTKLIVTESLNWSGESLLLDSGAHVTPIRPLVSDVINMVVLVLVILMALYFFPPQEAYFSENVVQAGIAGPSSVVLLQNGTVLSSGHSGNGQLGQGIAENTGGFYKQVIELPVIKQILVITHQGRLALSTTGQVFSWGGYNYNYGHLGLGDDTGNTVDPPEEVKGIPPIKKLYGRRRNVFAITEDDDVYVWGEGIYGGLCNGDEINHHDPILITTVTDHKFISNGEFATFIIKNDGTVWRCGRMLRDSELSADEEEIKNQTVLLPTRFETPAEFVFIDNSQDHALALDVDGNVWSWGSGANGRLGLGSDDSFDYPQKKILGRDHYDGDPNDLPGKVTSTLSGLSVAFAGVDGSICWVGTSNDVKVVSLDTESKVEFKDESFIESASHFNLSTNVLVSGKLVSHAFFDIKSLEVNGLLILESSHGSDFSNVLLGKEECSTIETVSTLNVEYLEWYCGTFNGHNSIMISTVILQGHGSKVITTGASVVVNSIFQSYSNQTIVVEDGFLIITPEIRNEQNNYLNVICTDSIVKISNYAGSFSFDSSNCTITISFASITVNNSLFVSSTVSFNHSEIISQSSPSNHNLIFSESSEVSFDDVMFMKSIGIYSYVIDLSDSELTLLNLNSSIFIFSLTLLNSNVYLSPDFPIICSEFIKDESSQLFQSNLIINLADQSCCRTNHCVVTFPVNNATFLKDSLTVDTFHASDNTVDFQSNSIVITLNNVTSNSTSICSLVTRFLVDVLTFQQNCFVSICPIEFDFVSPRTGGGHFGITGNNFGLESVIVSSFSDVIYLDSTYTGSNHSFLTVLFLAGDGCHHLNLSRSTDSCVTSTRFCYRKPDIFVIEPYDFPLAGELRLIGDNFSNNLDYLSLSSAVADLTILSHSHRQIFLWISAICPLSTSTIPIYLVVGNQTSNTFILNLVLPSISYNPVMLPPVGGVVYIETAFISLGQIIQCFANTSILFQFLLLM
ncbi:hypothetical protein GEMRC1_011600 [Eukaryota sp. GEM-RC1]